MNKAKRQKIECLVCRRTFDFDYRTSHNEKCHRKAAFSKRYRLADVRTSGNLCLHSRFPDVFSALPIGPIAKTGGAGGMA